MGPCLEIEFLKLMIPSQQQELERRQSYYLAVQCYCLWLLDQCSRLFFNSEDNQVQKQTCDLLISRSTMSWEYIRHLVWVHIERLHCT